jgi:hypothetical protein
MRRHIPAYHGAGADDRSFADMDVRQDDAVRPNEHVLFNHNLPIAFRPLGSPVKVSEDGGSKTNSAIVADRNILRMQFIEIHELGDPNASTDVRSPQAMQPRPKAASPGTDKGNFMN